MIFATDLHRINIDNIKYCNNTRNTVINGIFTKINYTTNVCVLNGLYILFPIESLINQSNRIEFNPFTEYNEQFIKTLSGIENNILNKYITNNNLDIKKKNILNSQLYTGFMKIYKDVNRTGNITIHNDMNKNLILKISGIWDTGYTCGITYKLYECSHTI
jgi:hypothetical protein